MANRKTIMSRGFCIILAQCASQKEADAIRSALLKGRLAACVNILKGVDSRFWWNGKVDRAKEVLLMAKSRRTNFNRIAKEIKRLHSYDVPEIIAIPIIAGSGDYLGWIRKNTKA